MNTHHASEPDPDRRRSWALIAALVGVALVIGVAAIATHDEPTVQQGPASSVAAVPAQPIPAPDPVHEGHVQEAASTPAGEVAASNSQRVQADREAAAGSETAVQVQRRINEALGGQALMFQPDTATLTSDSRARLERVADVLRADPAARVELVGHTAVEISNPDLCLQLSQLRAEQVGVLLSTAGIDPQRVTTVGVSHTQPLDSAWASRRVEVVALAH